MLDIKHFLIVNKFMRYLLYKKFDQMKLTYDSFFVTISFLKCVKFEFVM